MARQSAKAEARVQGLDRVAPDRDSVRCERDGKAIYSCQDCDGRLRWQATSPPCCFDTSTGQQTRLGVNATCAPASSPTQIVALQSTSLSPRLLACANTCWRIQRREQGLRQDAFGSALSNLLGFVRRVRQRRAPSSPSAQSQASHHSRGPSPGPPATKAAVISPSIATTRRLTASAPRRRQAFAWQNSTLWCGGSARQWGGASAA